MSEPLGARYWCHMCSQMVNPIMDVEIKCPFCESGFVEEMDSQRDDDSDIGSERALSLWAPILLGMMGGARRRRLRREDDTHGEQEEERESRDPESFSRRRRRNSAIFQLLHGLRNSELDVSENENDRERVILINPFNQALVLQGSFDSNDTHNHNSSPPGSLGDYFVGPGLEILLQHLAENDPNRYGTPPAKKEAVEAMPTVKVKENLQCSVCLDDFDMGSEAKEMPCKHKFHCDCIMPWLELHSSCPVCRFQLPSDGLKGNSNESVNANRTESENGSSEERGNDVENESGRNYWVPVPWPFNGLFSMSGGNSSSSASGSDSRSDEN